jgi:Tol biopolymer transport system component
MIGGRTTGARRRALGAAAALALAAGLSGCWKVTLATPNAAGTDTANSWSNWPVLSADGTKVAFTSNATDLGPTDTNGQPDLYVRDLKTGVNRLVSANASGTDAGNGGTWVTQSISPDGSKVAFDSTATDLTSPGASTTGYHVYVRDLTAGATTLASADRADATGGVFSPDGRKLLWSAGPRDAEAIYETDLTTGAVTRLTDGTAAMYAPSGGAVAFQRAGGMWLIELATGRVTLASGGLPGTTWSGYRWSGDGNRLAFNRVVGGLEDIYVYDRTTRTAQLATPALDGNGGVNRGNSVIAGFHPSNPDLLLFSSEASNLVPGDTLPRQYDDVFVRDLAAGVTMLVSSNRAGTGVVCCESNNATWLGDGNRVAFVSFSRDLGPADTNSNPDVYVRDLATGETKLVSVNKAGDNGGNGWSGRWHDAGIDFGEPLSASADGSRLAFGTDASDLGPADHDVPPPDFEMYTNQIHDIYVADTSSAT